MPEVVFQELLQRFPAILDAFGDFFHRSGFLGYFILQLNIAMLRPTGLSAMLLDKLQDLLDWSIPLSPRLVFIRENGVIDAGLVLEVDRIDTVVILLNDLAGIFTRISEIMSCVEVEHYVLIILQIGVKALPIRF